MRRCGCRSRSTQYAEEVRRAHGIAVQIRVGLNSGEVVVRAIGSDLHMDYTAVGQTTHLAARMEQLAEPGRDPADRRHAAAGRGLRRRSRRSGRCPSRAWRTPVRGLRADREPSAARSRLQAAAARGPDALRRAGRRAGAAPPGARARRRRPRPGGRHRRRARRRQVAARLGGHALPPHPRLARARERARSPTARRPRYLPVIDLLKAYFRIEDRDDARGRSARR